MLCYNVNSESHFHARRSAGVKVRCVYANQWTTSTEIVALDVTPEEPLHGWYAGGALGRGTEPRTSRSRKRQRTGRTLFMLRSLVLDNGHSCVQVPKRSGILWKRTVRKEFGTISRKRCCWNSPKAHVQFSVLRPHCPEVNSKGHGKLSIHFAATQATIETVFA